MMVCRVGRMGRSATKRWAANSWLRRNRVSIVPIVGVLSHLQVGWRDRRMDSWSPDRGDAQLKDATLTLRQSQGGASATVTWGFMKGEAHQRSDPVDVRIRCQGPVRGVPS